MIYDRTVSTKHFVGYFKGQNELFNCHRLAVPNRIQSQNSTRINIYKRCKNSTNK